MMLSKRVKIVNETLYPLGKFLLCFGNSFAFNSYFKIFNK